MKTHRLSLWIALASGAWSAHAGVSTWQNSGANWGTAGNWSAGVPTDKADLPSAGVVVAPDLAGASYSVSQLSIVQSGAGKYNITNSGAVASLTLTTNGVGLLMVGNPANRGIYANLNLGLASRTDVQTWNLSGDIVAYGNQQFRTYGDIGGTGTLTLLGDLVHRFGTSPNASFNGDTVLNGSQLMLAPRLAASGNYRFGRNAANTWGGTIRIQNGGGLALAAFEAAAAGLVATNQNDLAVGAGNGYLYLVRGGWTDTWAGPNPMVAHSGTLTLGATLNISEEHDWLWGQGYGSTYSLFQNGIVLDQSAAAAPALSSGRGNPMINAPGISDGAGSAGNPFCVAAMGRGRFVLGAASTHAHGTIVCVTSGDGVQDGGLVANAAGALGTGHVTVHPGGLACLAVANVMSGSQTAYLRGNAMGTATLRLCEGTLPAISADSSGTIGLVGNSGANINALLAAGLPNDMFLGLGYDSTASAGTFTGTTLAAGSGNTYRLGTGGSDPGMWGWQPGLLLRSDTGTGPLQNVGGACSVQVGAPVLNGSGVVTFSEDNGFSGTLTVSRGSACGANANFGPHYSTLTLGSNGALGSTNSPVVLQGGNLRMYSNWWPTMQATNAVKGALSFSSDAMVEFYTDATPAAFLFDSNTRVGKGTLLLNTWAGTIGNQKRFRIRTPGADLTPVNGMVAPYYFVMQAWGSAMNFATYGAGGFAPAAYTSTDLNTSGASDIVNYAGGTLGAGARSAYALRISGNISGTAPGSTVTLGSGGVLGFADWANMTVDANTTLDFGGQEAVVFFGGTGSELRLLGKITNTGGKGLTKAGYGGVYIESLANDFTGPVTLNAGTLRIQFDQAASTGSFGGVTDLTLNGGRLYGVYSSPAQGDRLAASRTITLGPLGGAIQLDYWVNCLIQSKVTGSGALGLINSQWQTGQVIDNAANDYSGGTYVVGQQHYATATAKLGSGPVLLGGGGYMTFQGDGNLDFVNGPNHTYLPVTLSPGSRATFTSASPVMGGLSGVGSVVLNDTALTVGKDDADSTFYGVISQASGRTGSLTKDGNGTFTLHGVNTYTGATTVNDGTLRLEGAVAGNLVVASNGTLSGEATVAGNLTVSGTLETAIRSASDYDTLTVNGTATLSGTLTLPGPYVLQGNDEATVLTATGGFSGALTPPAGFVLRQSGSNLVLGRPKGSLIMIR